MREPSSSARPDRLTITHIQRQPRRRRLAILLSTGETISLTPDIAARFRLAAGQTLEPGRLHDITTAQAREDALAGALRLVAFRPRSEKEMRQALARRAVPPALQDETIARLRELRLLDDSAFAAAFVESRDRTSPRSRRLLAQELRQKGIPREIAAGAPTVVNEASAAYRAAQRRAAALKPLPYPDFQRRLGDFLLRRGFSYDTARATVRRLWAETRDAATGDPPGFPSIPIDDVYPS